MTPLHGADLAIAADHLTRAAEALDRARSSAAPTQEIAMSVAGSRSMVTSALRHLVSAIEGQSLVVHERLARAEALRDAS